MEYVNALVCCYAITDRLVLYLLITNLASGIARNTK